MLTLALTMGVGTAIFALLDAVVLTPPPFVEPESLVLVGEVPAGTTAATPYPVSWTTFQRWREYRRAVTQVEAFDSTNMTLTGRGPAERVSGTAVTTGFFSLLGISTVLGRTWSEEQSDSDVAVVSEGFWREKLGMDAALGRPILLGGRSFTVIGVLPPQFEFGLNPSDVWVPLRRLPRVRVLARLAPGTSAVEASLVLDEVSRQATPPAKALARPVTAVIAGSAAAIVPLMLVAAAVAVSLAVINLTGLLGVRAIERHREFAIRRALGARTIEIVKQVVVEAHVVVAAGAAGGILVALWVTPWVGRLGRIPATGISVSWKAMAALGIVAWACAWLCGLAVAARGYRVSGSELLSRATSPGPRERSLRSALVCIEVMLAFVLLASLALVGRSLQRTLAIDPGFDAAGVLTAGVSLPRERYPDAPRVAAFYRSVGTVLSDRWGAGTSPSSMSCRSTAMQAEASSVRSARRPSRRRFFASPGLGTSR